MSWLGLKTAGSSEANRRIYKIEYNRESYEVEYRRVPRVIEHRYGSLPRNPGVIMVDAFHVPSSFDHDRPKEVDELLSRILTEVNPPYKHSTAHAMGQDHGYKHDHGYRDDSPSKIGQDRGYKHHGPLSTIDSQEAAKRNGNLAQRSNPEDKYREVIDSDKAVEKYKGAYVPK